MTRSDTFVIEPLGRRQDRVAFSCGLPELNRYLVRQAGQDIRRRITRVFVCTVGQASAVLGFYTLSALSMELTSLPDELSRKLPCHPVPCTLIGRLATDCSMHGRGLGRMLLADAVKRTVAACNNVTIHVLIVDAVNEDAKRFYERSGFVLLTNDPMRLFLHSPLPYRRHVKMPDGQAGWRPGAGTLAGAKRSRPRHWQARRAVTRAGIPETVRSGGQISS